MYCKYCGKETENENCICNECSEPKAEPVNVNYSENGNSVKEAGHGTASLVLGIVGLVLGNWICSLIGLILGIKAKNTESEKNGHIGKILSIVGLALAGVSMVISIICIPFYIRMYSVIFDQIREIIDGAGEGTYQMMKVLFSFI